MLLLLLTLKSRTAAVASACRASWSGRGGAASPLLLPQPAEPSERCSVGKGNKKK